MPISDFLGLALRSLREEKGLLQRDVAQRSGLARTQIIDYESGKTGNPGWDKVERILEALEVSFVGLAHRMHELAGEPVAPPQPKRETLPLEVFVGIRAQVEEASDVQDYVRRAAEAFSRAYPARVSDEDLAKLREGNGE